MLSSIRNNRRALSIVLWLVIVAFVATIFVVWGVGEKTSSQNYIAKVGNRVITYNEFNNTLRNVEESLRLYGGQVEIDNLPQRVLESIIADKVMLIEAEKYKIPVTDVDVITNIQSKPAFLVDGKFNMAQYQAVLNNNGISVKQFEDSIREEVLLNKFRAIITESQNVVTDKEIEKEYNYRKSTVNLDYAVIPLNTFEANYKAPNDDELKKYFDFTKEMYRVPTEIKVKYVTFDKNKFIENFTVSDEDAKNYFDNNQQKYDQKESTELSMIVIPLEFNDNATKSKAEKAYNELKEGKAFAEVANTYSNKNLVGEDGYLGTIENTKLQPDIAEIVKKTAENTFSEVTKTSAGYSIVYVHKKLPAKKYSFEEKKEEIKNEIKTSAAANGFNNYILEEYKKIIENGNITALQKAVPNYKEPITETDYVAENALFPVTAVITNETAKKMLYALEKGGVSQIITDNNVAYVFEMVDKKVSYIPEMDKVKELLLVNYKVDNVTKEGIKNIEKELAGSDFEKTAAKYNAVINKHSFVRENATFEQLFKNDAGLIEKIVTTNSGEFLKQPYLLDDNFYIFKISSTTLPNKDNLTSEKENIKNYIAMIKANSALESFTKKALENIKVEYNKDFLNSYNMNIQ